MEDSGNIKVCSRLSPSPPQPLAQHHPLPTNLQDRGISSNRDSGGDGQRCRSRQRQVGNWLLCLRGVKGGLQQKREECWIWGEANQDKEETKEEPGLSLRGIPSSGVGRQKELPAKFRGWWGERRVPGTTSSRWPERKPPQIQEEESRAKSPRPGSRTGLAPGPSG